jgi:uncharacterized repeat protein (TIGR02543 family)
LNSSNYCGRIQPSGDTWWAIGLTNNYVECLAITPATLYAGTVVTLTASPAAGYVFTGWSGALSGTKNPSTVTMDADKKVTASFAVRVMSVIELKIGSTTMYVDGKPASLEAAPGQGH